MLRIFRYLRTQPLGMSYPACHLAMFHRFFAIHLDSDLAMIPPYVLMFTKMPFFSRLRSNFITCTSRANESTCLMFLILSRCKINAVTRPFFMLVPYLFLGRILHHTYSTDKGQCRVFARSNGMNVWCIPFLVPLDLAGISVSWPFILLMQWKNYVQVSVFAQIALSAIHGTNLEYFPILVIGVKALDNSSPCNALALRPIP